MPTSLVRAERTGPTWGGLLNATFGNAAELIIAVIALTKGFNDVVKASLTGSILGNLLLVGGAAMLVGGWRRERQHFNPRAAEANAGLLVVAVAALLFPAIFHFTAERLHDVKDMFDRADAPAAHGWSVLFGEEGDTPMEDLDAIEQFGWPVATPEAYPAALRIRPGPSIDTPPAPEVRFLTAALEGAARLAQHPEARQTTVELPEATVQLTRLGWVGEM